MNFREPKYIILVIKDGFAFADAKANADLVYAYMEAEYHATRLETPVNFRWNSGDGSKVVSITPKSTS